MNDPAELIESILIYTAAYPITLWNLVFDPSLVFNALTPDRVCPPAIAYLITVVIVYYGFRITHPTACWKELPEWCNENFLLILAALYIAVIANLQQFAISKAGDITDVSFPTQLGALMYAICPTVVVSIPFVPVLRRRSISLVLVLAVVTHALYVYCLWNVIRNAFGLSGSEAIWATAYAYGTFILVVLLIPVAAIIAESRS